MEEAGAAPGQSKGDLAALAKLAKDSVPTDDPTNGSATQELTEPPKLPVLDIRPAGLGYLAVLSDKQIEDLFEEELEPRDLCALSLVSRAMYVFAEEDELWKKMCLKKWKADFVWKGTWKRTTIMPKDVFPTEPAKKIPVVGFYSDYFYNRWYRSHVPMSHWGSLPTDLPPEKLIERRSGLSLEEFIEEYASKNKPVILTDVVTKWPAWIHKSWTREALLRRAGDCLFRISEPDPDTGKKMMIKLSTYFSYTATSSDLDPLYIFDPYFDDNCPMLLGDYEVPEYFREDYLTLMNEDRPSYRWVVIGTSRSGTSFHLDPFKTSAWNALLVGRKRWALYPPGYPPPGVSAELDDDGSPSYSGLEPIDWYLQHYTTIRRLGTPHLQPIECIQEEGEMIYVPSGWWHMVWNLSETVAVTQNYCDRFIFPAVYEDMKWTKSHYFEHIYWTEQMMRFCPDIMATGLIHPGYWTRHDHVQYKKSKKQMKALRKERKAQEKQMKAWLEGMSEEMRKAFLARMEEEKAQQEAERVASGECSNVVMSGLVDETKAYTEASFWRAPVMELDEEDLAEVRGYTTTTTTTTLPLNGISNLRPKESERETEARAKEFSTFTFWKTPISELEEALL